MWWIIAITIVFAQNTKEFEISVPSSVSQNCLLTSSGGIDFCPQYRAQVRNLNTQLHQTRSHQILQGENNLILYLNDKIAQSRSVEWQEKQILLEWYQRFIYDYERYIHELLYKFLQDNINVWLWEFWKMTYFNDDQWWLHIHGIKIYGTEPERYDRDMTLQVSIRNFSNNLIGNIEDLYCFSTINNQDYIYPMNISTIFKPNTITNMIIKLDSSTSPLFERIGNQSIACTLVYEQFQLLKYTNRSTLSFLVGS